LKRKQGTRAFRARNTELKGSEGVLRESEQRFRLVADTAPVLIWMSGPDKKFTFLNDGWLKFTGRSIDSELGDGWAEGVHAEDLQRCLDTYTQAFDLRKGFSMEYRLRRHDEEYRWVLDIGAPRFDQERSFAGYIGSCVDITDRKLAETALANVNHRMIEAQEQERTRIARELHDDIGQRLAIGYQPGRTRSKRRKFIRNSQPCPRVKESRLRDSSRHSNHIAPVALIQT
jgi:PAS domain S-box-containing protein